MAFDPTFGAVLDAMGGKDLLLFLLSLVVIVSISATLVRPFLGKV
jgi:hypothetical protein